MSDKPETHAHKPRVAIFVESHEGYGHFNIVAQLAKQLEERGAEVMILSGTLNYAGAAQTFNLGESRIINLPLVDYRLTKGGGWEYTAPDGSLYENSPDYIAQRKKAVTSAIENFKPDLVLSELFPFTQSFREHDIEAVSELKRTGAINPEISSLCRDIIHNSTPQRVLKALDNHFERIFIRGDSRFTQLVDSQPEWGEITTPIEYTGNFITDMPKKDETIPESQRHVVIFGGGGYYDKDLPFFENLIRSRAHSQKFGDRLWDIYISENAGKHLVADPEDPSGGKKISALDYIQRLAAMEGHGMIRVFPPIDSEKFRTELANAAVTINRGGYNTTFELFAAKQHQLVIPREDKEQIQRANSLYIKGIAQVFPEYPVNKTTMLTAIKDVKKLAEAIDITPELNACVPEFNNHGAENTADRIIELCAQRTKEAHAVPSPDVHDASAMQVEPEKGAARGK